MDRYLLGFGNYSAGDDGIGLHIIEYIIEHHLDQGFQAVGIGNDGMQLLTYFTPETERIVMVDAAYIDKQPGEYLIIDPSQVETQKIVSKITTHEGDVLKLIELGKQLGYPIPAIRIVAIQPESVVMGMELSHMLSTKLATYSAICIRLIQS
jgi:hydrogenase maturation protease